MSGIALEAETRRALEVALGMAAASADEHCGTEHLLFGVVATASSEVADLADLFALDVLRTERGVRSLRSAHCHPDRLGVDPPLSTRAELALSATARSGASALGQFDLLVSILSDPRSGASSVLRSLGVRLTDIRRMAELGAARLDRREVAGLLAALDRRGQQHAPWWGPSPDENVVRVDLEGNGARVLARSDTAIATLDSVIVGRDGYGFTVTISSCDRWFLPPCWEPREELLPGLGSVSRVAPDVVSLAVADAGGAVVTNGASGDRWQGGEPVSPSLVRIGSSSFLEDRNDRRSVPRRTETCEWWVWPLPRVGPLVMTIGWAAEALHGVIEIDGSEIVARSDSLRGAS